jgi:hypothetical protein
MVEQRLAGLLQRLVPRIAALAESGPVENGRL